MTSPNQHAAGSTDTPSPANADLLKETRWIAQTTGVVRRDRQTRVWGPDLDALGEKIGRTTGAFKALRSGGNPDLPTLRLLLAYALKNIEGYNSVRFALACGLVQQEHVTAYAQEGAALHLPASDLARRVAERLREQPPEYRHPIQAALRDIVREVLTSLEHTDRAEPPST